MSECMWICHPPAIAICGHCYVRLFSSRRFLVSIYFGPATLPLLSAVRSALEFIISGKLFLGQGDFSGTNFGFNCIADTIIMCGVPLEACSTPKTYQGTHLCIPAVSQSCWCFFFSEVRLIHCLSACFSKVNFVPNEIHWSRAAFSSWNPD